MKIDGPHICILTSPRSGSTWLVELLNQHPHLSSYVELFRGKIPNESLNSQRRSTVPEQFYFEYSAKKRFPNLIRIKFYLEYFLSNIPDGNVLSFKIMYNHVAKKPAILFWLYYYQFVIVHLKREDSLSVAISWEVKKTKDRLGIPEDSKAKVPINYNKIARKFYMHKLSVKIAGLLTKIYPGPVMEIFYEDLLSDYDSVCKEVLDFVGVDYSNFEFKKEKREKNVKHSYREIIENFEEIREKVWKRQGVNLS